MRLRGEIEVVKARPGVVQCVAVKGKRELRHLALAVGEHGFDGLRVEFHLADAEALIRELQSGVIWLKQGDQEEGS